MRACLAPRGSVEETGCSTGGDDPRPRGDGLRSTFSDQCELRGSQRIDRRSPPAIGFVKSHKEILRATIVDVPQRRDDSSGSRGEKWPCKTENTLAFRGAASGGPT